MMIRDRLLKERSELKRWRADERRQMTERQTRKGQDSRKRGRQRKDRRRTTRRQDRLQMYENMCRRQKKRKEGRKEGKKKGLVRHVTGNDKDYLRKIPRVVW